MTDVGSEGHPEAIDPDVDLSGAPARQDSIGPVIAVIALGGVIGAEARYGLGLTLPHRPGELAWSTVLINVTGCLLLGALMVVLLELTTPHRLVRPILGVGVLGGYTTFSTFGLDTDQLLRAGRVSAALLYVFLTVLTGLAATWSGAGLARRMGSGRRRVGGG